MELRVLAIAPHPDDAEIGLGGTILSLRDKGIPVGILDLTNGEPTPKGSPEKREREWKKASSLLDLNFRDCLFLPNRYLFDTKEARIKVAEVIRLLRPEVLFLPYFVDAHPDHVAASRIGEAARFYAKLTKFELAGSPFYPKKIFYYLSNHLRLHFHPSFVVDISPFFSKKLEAVLAYKSQFGYGEREKMIERYLETTNGYYGRLIGTKYGEPFFSHEPIGVMDVDQFLSILR